MSRVILLALACWFLTLLPAAAQKPWAGTYAGDWSSAAIGAAKGAFRMTLRSPAEGTWECEVRFTIGERDVATTVKSLRVADSKIEVSYEFDLSENRLMSTITSELVEDKLEGKYQTKTVPEGAPVDEGTWKATRRK